MMVLLNTNGDLGIGTTSPKLDIVTEAPEVNRTNWPTPGLELIDSNLLGEIKAENGNVIDIDPGATEELVIFP